MKLPFAVNSRADRGLFPRAGTVAAALLLASCAASSAPPRFWTSAADYPKGFLASSSGIDAASFLPPPPKAGSAIDRSDKEIIEATRRLEGSPRWEIAKIDAVVGYPDAPRAFECALGTRFDPEKAPVLTRLLARVLPDVETVQHGVKRGEAFRARPYVAGNLKTCVAGDGLAKSSSYPSGHAAIGWAWALILAEIAPGRTDALLRRGLAYGESRVVCGFHYPSDVDAGRQVGSALVARLQSEPAYAAELAQARVELTALRASAPRADRCSAEDSALAEQPW